MLGGYAHARRNAVTKAVGFDRRLCVNNCQIRTRDLLDIMADPNLSRAKFDEIDVNVPLKKRTAEASGNTAYGSRGAPVRN